jgi:ParB family chromosome partitioning protein
LRPRRLRVAGPSIILGDCESITSKQTWRSSSPTDADYFTQLAAWGYSLSDVEQIVTGTTGSKATAEGVNVESGSAGENGDHR